MRRGHRRMFRLIVLCGVMIAGLIVPAAAQTTVNVASWWDAESGGFLDTLKTAFEAEHPDIEIEYTTESSAGYYDKLQVTIATGTPPDVAMLGFDWIAIMAENGLAMNIDRLVRENFPVDALFPAVRRALQWKGDYYALSRDITAKAFYYNRDHFAEAGIAFPSDDDWTWETFMAAAARLKQTDGQGGVTRWGFATGFVLDGHYHWFPTNGSDWFNADRTALTMTDPRTVETAQFLQDLIHTYHLAPTPSERGGAGSFLNGLISMEVRGSGAPDPNEYPNLNWGVSLLPYNEQPGTRIWSNLWFIPSTTDQPEAAWEVLSFFGGPEGQRIAGRLGNGIPAIRSIAMEMDYDPYILRAFEIGVPYPVIANRRVWDVFNSEFPKFWRNQMPAQTLGENIERLAAPLM